MKIKSTLKNYYFTVDHYPTLKDGLYLPVGCVMDIEDLDLAVYLLSVEGIVEDSE